MLLSGENANSFQPVEIRLSISDFIFHSKIALQSISYMTKVFVKNLVTNVYSKDAYGKNT